MLDESLTSLEKKLGPLHFVRVHRSELINIDYIRSLRTTDGATELELTDGQRVPVSRRSSAELKRRLGIS